MSDSIRPEHRWCWPVARADEAADAPQRVSLLDEDHVLWRAADGAPVLLPDRCPHRGASLSMGCVREGTLQCGYHGWRFGADGRCVAIPALPGHVPSAAQGTRAIGLRKAHGLLWADLAAGGGGVAALPALPEGLPPRTLLIGPFDVATSAPRVIENFLDTAHFAFVHEGWLGDAAHPEVPPVRVQAGADGRPFVPHYRAWQPRATAAAAGGDWVDYRYEVLSPYAALLVKQAAGGGPADAYAIWCAPQHSESTRVWFGLWTGNTEASDAELADFQRTIFLQDQPILESQRPRRLPLSGGEVSGGADALSTAYRRYLQRCGIGFGTC